MLAGSDYYDSDEISSSSRYKGSSEYSSNTIAEGNKYSQYSI